MSAQRSASRQRGQILPMVAIMAVVLVAIIGLAVDIGRITVAKAQLVRAVDAAALAGVLKLPELSEVEAEVYLYMSENEPDATVEVPTSPAERQVRVLAHKDVDLTFMSVLTLLPGIDLTDPVTLSADAIAGYGILPVDVVMDIDATGTMGSPDRGCNWWDDNPGCPIKEAKDAATGFTDILLGDSPGTSQTVVGVAPYRHCYNPPRSSSRCVPGDWIADLSNDKAYVQGKIDDIEAGYWTNVCLGLYKGREIVTGPGSHDQSNTLRIVVLLSDGDNNYSSDSYGQGQPPEECRPPNPSSSQPYANDAACLSSQTQERDLDEDTKALTDAMKADGIEIYVVGFGVCGDPNENLCDPGLIGSSAHDNTADRNLLKCVASSTSGTNDHYFEVPNAEDLPEVFGDIARQIAFRLIK